MGERGDVKLGSGGSKNDLGKQEKSGKEDEIGREEGRGKGEEK